MAGDYTCSAFTGFRRLRENGSSRAVAHVITLDALTTLVSTS